MARNNVTKQHGGMVKALTRAQMDALHSTAQHCL
jgi:hypothetical protein